MGVSMTLMWLLLINAALFLLGAVVSLFTTLLGGGIDWAFYSLALPAYIPQLLHEPWTLVTYMFYHQDISHIFWNLIWFWAFGRLFEIHRSQRQLRDLYILGGFAGGLLYVLAYTVFPYFHPELPYSRALGASAAIMAITVAAAYDDPNRQVYLYGLIRVRVKWIALVAIIIDLLSITGGNAGGHIAHLGGAFVGFLYIYMAKSGRDIGAWLDPIFNAIQGSPTRRKRGKRVRFTESKRRRRTSPPPRQKPQTDREMQRILEKLRTGGYDSLSAEEKAKLFRK